jgi:hypothetical protein
LKEGIHVKREGQVRTKGTRLRVKELCRQEKRRESRRERGRDRIVELEMDMEMEEGEGEEEGGKEGQDREEGQGEGNMECTTALVDAFEFYLSLLTSRCTACTLHISQAVSHNFKETLEAIKSAMDGIQQAVSSIAGSSSVLMVRMQERASEASFSCILSMQSCSSTCGTRSRHIILCCTVSFFVCASLCCPFLLFLTINLTLSPSSAFLIYSSSCLLISIFSALDDFSSYKQFDAATSPSALSC